MWAEQARNCLLQLGLESSRALNKQWCWEATGEQMTSTSTSLSLNHSTSTTTSTSISNKQKKPWRECIVPRRSGSDRMGNPRHDQLQSPKIYSLDSIAIRQGRRWISLTAELRYSLLTNAAAEVSMSDVLKNRDTFIRMTNSNVVYSLFHLLIYRTETMWGINVGTGSVSLS